MEEPTWLDISILEAIHSDLIREHGGSPGIRDESLFRSALARPRQKWTYHEDVDLSALAAAYGYGLARNHAFVDGNKRVGLMAMYVFLLVNGRELEVSEAAAVDIMIGVADGSIGEDELAAWVRHHGVDSVD